jgi:formylglycine-generating enzyme required for sulfatase activity
MQPRSRASLFLIAITAAISRCPAQVRDETTGRLVPTADTGVVFVLLPGGVLPVEDGNQPDHRHTVRLDPFFLSKYELTQGQWLRLTGTNPSHNKDQDNLALPVDSVNWFDCEEVLRHAGWVLPSELQWEYGCRARTTTKWWTGATEESLRGNENGGWEGKGVVLPVGSMAPNPFGLFDASGNLWEWCFDWFGEYGTELAGDGVRPNQGSATRVHRGTCFGGNPFYAQSGRQARSEPTHPDYGCGVRPAMPFRP